MNLSAIFTAAHATARTLTAGTYRARFAQGLKAAYAAAKQPVKKSAYEVLTAVLGPDYEVAIWNGGDKKRAYITAPAQSNAYKQVGYIDLARGTYSLSVHPTRTSRGREFDGLLKLAAAAI